MKIITMTVLLTSLSLNAFADNSFYEKLLPLAKNLKTCIATSITALDTKSNTEVTKTLTKSGDLCIYTETLPNIGTLSCDLPLEMASKISDYYVELTEYLMTPVEKDASSPVPLLVLDGEEIENPMQYALDKKMCKVT